jgi:hypothetical protein
MEGWPSLRVFIDFTLLIFLSCILSREPILRLTALDGFFDNLTASALYAEAVLQKG